MSYSAAYLMGPGERNLRSPGDFVLETSRRARGFATWAALRQLGRHDLAALIERCCVLARRFGEQLADIEGASVLNDIVLNQVLVRFGDDENTDRVIEATQRSGECWMGATSWRGERAMRISVSNWSTSEVDVDRSVNAIRAATSQNAQR
jgi:glutamate/tyrosine decarboxylase-like PLP-dependent enzyme